MFKKFLINWSNLRGSKGKWRMGLMLVSVIGQLILNGHGYCQCSSQTTSDSCNVTYPNSDDMQMCNDQGSPPVACVYCEWVDASPYNSAYCTATGSSSNCPVNNYNNCPSSLGRARTQGKKSDVKTRNNKSQPK